MALTSIDLGATVSILKNIANRFDRMYHKRAFVHWFVGVGMGSGEYSYKREDFESMIKDYEDMEE